MWQPGHDLILLTNDGQNVTTSGWLLKRASLHFKSLLSNVGFEEATTGRITVGLTAECAQHIVHFVHTGQIPASLSEDPHALLLLLQAAASISMDHLVAVCEAKLIGFLDCENCLGLLQAATDHHCTGLQSAAMSVALKKFTELKFSPDWVELPAYIAEQIEHQFLEGGHIHSVDRLVSSVTDTDAE